jgi:hypothetical protein
MAAWTNAMSRKPAPPGRPAVTASTVTAFQYVTASARAEVAQLTDAQTIALTSHRRFILVLRQPQRAL